MSDNSYNFVLKHFKKFCGKTDHLGDRNIDRKKHNVQLIISEIGCVCELVNISLLVEYRLTI
jgi:hypothetical protein